MESKWKATFTATLPKSDPNQIWQIFTDFFNVNKWLPSLSACHGVHGDNGRPGCVRYCAGSSIPTAGETDPAAVSWTKERLISVDDVERVMRYEIVESNIGFHNYVSTVKVVAGAAESGGGCGVEWSISLDLVEGLEYEALVKMYEVGLQIMVQNMENHL